jgi:hypothetical protein
MAGSAANTRLWRNADVYIAPVNTVGPADVTAAWGASWSAVGLLDGEEGFTETREDEQNEHYAWGGLLVKSVKSKHKRMIKFVALEDNADVFALVNPGSTRTTSGTPAVTTSTVKVPTNAEFAIGFEVQEGTTRKRRVVKRATIQEIGEVKESESELAMYEITVALLPESDGTLYVERSGTVTP